MGAGMMPVTIEIGPKGKRAVAVAPEWPGLERGARTAALAVDRLQVYRERYRPVAVLAGLDPDFDKAGPLDVVAEYEGTGSTDFWGISYAFSPYDHQPLSPDVLERELSLVRASWTFFDQVRGRVSAELKKGPRGGGRDRDQIVAHTISVEAGWAAGIGVQTPDDRRLTDEEIDQHRLDYLEAIRQCHAEGLMAKKWPLRFLIRHTAYHTLDHAWEMEDKDLGSATS